MLDDATRHKQCPTVYSSYYHVLPRCLLIVGVPICVSAKRVILKPPSKLGLAHGLRLSLLSSKTSKILGKTSVVMCLSRIGSCEKPLSSSKSSKINLTCESSRPSRLCMNRTELTTLSRSNMRRQPIALLITYWPPMALGISSAAVFRDVHRSRSRLVN
jgi:hypothetical protein